MISVILVDRDTAECFFGLTSTDSCLKRSAKIAAAMVPWIIGFGCTMAAVSSIVNADYDHPVNYLDLDTGRASIVFYAIGVTVKIANMFRACFCPWEGSRKTFYCLGNEENTPLNTPVKVTTV